MIILNAHSEVFRNRNIIFQSHHRVDILFKHIFWMTWWQKWTNFDKQVDELIVFCFHFHMMKTKFENMKVFHEILWKWIFEVTLFYTIDLILLFVIRKRKTMRFSMIIVTWIYNGIYVYIHRTEFHI